MMPGRICLRFADSELCPGGSYGDTCTGTTIYPLGLIALC